MASEKLSIILELITGNYKREAREAATATGRIGDAATGAIRPIGGLGSAVGKLGGVLAGAFAASQITQFASASITAASDLEESINAVNVVFGEAGAAIHEFGETSADAVGLAAVNVNKSATVLGSALINAGFAADEAAEKTIELTTRAADMASVFNTEVPEALGAIQSALRGETDPIEKFGVSLTAAAVEAEAAALGFEKVAGEFTATDKAAARLSIIMAQTDRVAGDFANTADSTANTMKRLKERFVEMQGRIGQALMPAFTALLEVADKMGPAFEEFAVSIAESVVEMKPLIEGLGELVKWYTAVKGAIGDVAESEDLDVAGLGTIVDILTSGGITALGKALDFWDRITPAKEMDKTTEASVKLHDTWITLGKATDDVAGTFTGLGDSLVTIRPKLKDVTDAYMGLTSAMLASTDPVFAAVTAMQRLDEAQKDPKTSALDLAEAVIEAQTALNNLAAGNIEQAIGIIADALGVTDDAARDLLESAGLLKDLEDIVINVLLKYDAEGTPLPPGGLTLDPAVVAAIEEAFPDTTAGTTVGTGGRASGGPVTAGQPYLVGERGPELMVPMSNGTIIPNSQLGGSKSVTVNVGSTGNISTDYQLATILATVVTLVEVQN